jgi:hypothetical protein
MEGWMNENKFDSFEQAVEHYTRIIRLTRSKIIEDFYIAYAAQLSHLEGFSLDDICLIEQETDPLTRRYWFEYKLKFKNEWTDE